MISVDLNKVTQGLILEAVIKIFPDIKSISNIDVSDNDHREVKFKWGDENVIINIPYGGSDKLEVSIDEKFFGKKAKLIENLISIAVNSFITERKL